DNSLSVLVAEDNEVNALLTRSLLARLGHRPDVVADGASAVDSWLAAVGAGTPYDVVLMDLQMPVVDGIEATRPIRAHKSARMGPRTRIRALTANTRTEDREAAMEAGVDGYLIKPLDRDRLAETLTGLALSPVAA